MTTPTQSALGAANSTTTPNVTFGSSVSAGDLLTLEATNYTSGGTSYITAVSGGGTWVKVVDVPYNSGGTGTVELWYCLSATGGATTVTTTIPTAQTGSYHFQVNEWPGSWTFDKYASTSNVAASTTVTASITPSAIGNLLIAGATGNALTNTDWTKIDSAFETAASSYTSFTYTNAASTSSQSATWSQASSSYSWGAMSFAGGTVAFVPKTNLILPTAVMRAANR